MKPGALIVLADALWQEGYPGPTHVIAGEVAREHATLWLEAPIQRCFKAPGFGARLRRSLRLDLPRVHYVDGSRELDVLTPPAWPPGNAVGDALLNQTVRWILKGRKLEPRVLLLARRGPAAAALARGLKAAVVVDFHLDPQAGDRWLPEADLVLWPHGEPVPAGERQGDARLLRYTPGVRGVLKLMPMIEGWMTGAVALPGVKGPADRPGERIDA